MTRIVIRPAEEKDILGILKISKDTYGPGMFPHAFFYYSLIFWPDAFVVACDEDAVSKVIGYCLAGISQVDRTVAWGLGMAVEAEYEGTGVRAQMIVHMKGQLAAVGVQTIRLYLVLDDRLRRMVMNLGFRLVEIIPDRMGPGEDRCLMEYSFYE